MNIIRQIIDVDHNGIANFSLLGLAIGQIVFISMAAYSEPNGSLFGGLWVLSFVISPILVALDIYLHNGTEWEPPLKGALWMLGCLIPIASSSILITYVGRRYEVVSKESQWIGWPLVIGVSILAIEVSLILLIGFSDSPESDTFLLNLGVMTLFSLTLLPGLAMYYDLRFLKHSDEYDFPSYNWLWIIGIIVWFLQFGVFIGWVVWRIGVSSKSNHRAIINVISTPVKNTDLIPTPELDRTPSLGSETGGKKRIQTETTGGENDVLTAPEHRSRAESAIETGKTAKSNNDFDAAADAYNKAINEYQAALKSLEVGDTEQRAEIEAAIESTSADLEIAKTRHEQRNDIIDALQPAERSLQEAIVAYIENDQTVTRIRFRQARDTFEDAHETIAESEKGILTDPIEVSVQPDRELPSTTLSELSGIPEGAATKLADVGIKSVDDLDSRVESPWTPNTVEELVTEETIDEDVATTLTLLSWWHSGEGYMFETAEGVERRQQQADYGFNHTS